MKYPAAAVLAVSYQPLAVSLKICVQGSTLLPLLLLLVSTLLLLF
jgi:hypothetical protein